ncbi:MAG: tRNA uridine-5-carboxymethylaminomethyl(34) synthesis GTPase MnmE [Treponema sp.]|nr:tRNA uridine-5-carboxymethylaminomethyl(34) synthesis GTPase MnmE [Treponema sp.]
MDNTGYTPEEPIAAVATALAPAALGIIRVSGKNSIQLLSKIFSRPKALSSAAGNTIVYGWIVEPQNDGFAKSVGGGQDCSQDQNAADEKLSQDQNAAARDCVPDQKAARVDEVLVSVFRAPKSFTGEEMAEISCHGGTAVVTKIFNLLLQNGFRQAERGEFTFRAFINGKADLTKAEAVREIIESRTGASSQKAAGRLAGNLSQEIGRVQKSLIDTLAQIEVEIEYPEDEETIADAYDQTKLLEAIAALERLAHTWKSEKLYQEGARLVLCGKTNAGKSSLFNCLLKEERAIVSDIEGTTRDWIESWISLDGIPARLFDTAGLRSTSDEIEARGVESAKELSDEADLLLYLADVTLPKDQIDLAFLAERKEPVIFVWNKIDKLPQDKEASAQAEKVSQDQKAAISEAQKFYEAASQKIPALSGQVFVSAKNGGGVKDLVAMAKGLLLKGQETERSQAGLGSERQKRLVESALESLRHAASLQKGYSLDAAVQDIEDALDFLGELTGRVTADDILDSVFSNFCVGK